MDDVSKNNNMTYDRGTMIGPEKGNRQLFFIDFSETTTRSSNKS